jgi:hypothetical protein
MNEARSKQHSSALGAVWSEQPVLSFLRSRSPPLTTAVTHTTHHAPQTGPTGAPSPLLSSPLLSSPLLFSPRCRCRCTCPNSTFTPRSSAWLGQVRDGEVGVGPKERRKDSFLVLVPSSPRRRPLYTALSFNLSQSSSLSCGVRSRIDFTEAAAFHFGLVTSGGTSHRVSGGTSHRVMTR